MGDQKEREAEHKIQKCSKFEKARTVGSHLIVATKTKTHTRREAIGKKLRFCLKLGYNERAGIIESYPYLA
jgi:hypothetical protein